MRVLLVGCSPEFAAQFRSQLVHSDWKVSEAKSGTEALESLWESKSHMLLVSERLPDLRVPEFCKLVVTHFPEVQVMPLEEQYGQGTTPSARTAPEQEASFSREEPTRAVSSREWQGMVGLAPATQKAYQAARLVARRDTTVLIQGESGTGKDLLARAIHETSSRSRQPFVVINCAAIPEALLEAELFGYTKGSFTGASQSRTGRVHAADGGTLFLDEIGELPLSLQSKLLRFLEQGEVQRLGATESLKVNCRVIAATNVELKKQAQVRQFREDLYYRLAIFPIDLPPLRERMADVDALCAMFLHRFRPGATLHSHARALLLQHQWPGNIRELRNVLERATIFADERLEILPEDILF